MCEIRAVQIFGLTDNTGQIISLVADGTTEDCNQIYVAIERMSPDVTTSTRTVTANAAGQWRAVFNSADGDFNSRDFVCGEILLKVHATCVSDTNCQDTREFKQLACGTTSPPLPPPPQQPIQSCPETSVTPPSIGEDCVNGRRSVAISGVVTPAPDTIVSARMVLNDLNGQTVAVIDEAFGQTAQFSLGGAASAVDVLPGEYVARLEITRPNYCGANTEPASVSPCPEVPGAPDIQEPPDAPDTREPPSAPTVPESPAPVVSPCWVWFWINVGLFTAVGILVFVTLCLIEASVWAAVAAIGSGGTLIAIWVALSALNVAMLIASIGLIAASLTSFFLWIVFCAFGRMRNIICGVLALLMTILSALNAAAVVAAIILSIAGMVGCAVGAWIDVAWFSLLMSITWFTGQFLGCFPGALINRTTASR